MTQQPRRRRPRDNRRRSDVANTYDPNAAAQRAEQRNSPEAIAARAARKRWHSIGKKLTPFVLSEYGTTCHLCGCAGTATTADHVIPVAQGGTHTLDNLRPCCPPCNSARRDMPLDQWFRVHPLGSLDWRTGRGVKISTAERSRRRGAEPPRKSAPSRDWFGVQKPAVTSTNADDPERPPVPKQSAPSRNWFG